jgi:hypothetical protein
MNEFCNGKALLNKFPNIPHHNRRIYRIVWRIFLFPVDISLCPVLSVILSQLFAPRDSLLWPPRLNGNSSIRNCGDVITVSVKSVPTKLWSCKLTLWPSSHFFTLRRDYKRWS